MARVFYDIKSGVPGVRPAMKDDEGQIYALLLMLHAENGFFSLNHEKVIKGIQHATERRGGVIFVIEKDHRIVASLGMVIASDWYTDDEYLQERWNYVHPDYRRGTDYARKLIEQAKWSTDFWKATFNIDMPFMCGINSLDRTQAKIRLYARHMPCIGAYFAYGHAARQNDKIDQAMREIEECERERRRDNRKEKIIEKSVPVVETILRISRHV